MRRVLVDASAFITLAEIGEIELLQGVSEFVVLPEAVVDEIESGVAASVLEDAHAWIRTIDVDSHADMRDEIGDARRTAASHLGIDEYGSTESGDHALLTLGIHFGIRSGERIVVVTDDKPLRKACKALGIPISGSIGVVIAAVERGDVGPDEARDTLVAMDEVGARLSARLFRKAERLIDEAAEAREE